MPHTQPHARPHAQQRPRPHARHQHGYTLVELMTVLVIVGIIASAATFAMRGKPTAEGSTAVAAMLREARRHAIRVGVVRDDVRAAHGVTSRTRVVVGSVADRHVVRLYLLVEDDDSSAYDWELLGETVLPSRTEVHALGHTAAADAGATVPTALGSGVDEVAFYPDGSADAQTWWLRDRHRAEGDKYRVFVLPLAGTPQVVQGW